MNGLHCRFQGSVTQAAELRYTSEGQAMLRFGAVVNDASRRDDAEPEYVQVTVWASERLDVDTLQPELAAGREVYLEGRVRLGHWTDREGNPRASLNVRAWSVTPMSFGHARPLQAPSMPSRSQSEMLHEALAEPMTVEQLHDVTGVGPAAIRSVLRRYPGMFQRLSDSQSRAPGLWQRVQPEPAAVAPGSSPPW